MKFLKNYILTFLFVVGFINLHAQFIFQKALGTTSSDGPKDFIITSDNNYLVLGFAYASSPSPNGLYLSKLDTAGTILWEKIYDTIGGHPYLYISNTLCETTNFDIVVGAKYTLGGVEEGFLIKFDANNGDTLNYIHDSTLLGNNVTKVLQAPDGNLLALVDKNGASSLVKLDNNFNQLARIDSILPQNKGIEVVNNKIYYLKKDSINNLLIIDNDFTQIDTVTISIKYPKYLRKTIDETQLIFYGEQTLGPWLDRILSLVYTDLQGNIISVCDTIDNVGDINDFRPLDGTNNLIQFTNAAYSPDYGMDVQLYFTDNCGEILHDTILYRWSFSMHLDEIPTKVLVDADGNYLLFGRADNSILGESDIFLIKYKKWDGFPTGLNEINNDLIQIGNSIIAYPNPFQERIIIRGNTENSSITVMDIMGKIVFTYYSPLTTFHTIPTTNWAKGLYVIQIKNFEKTTTLKVVKQ